MASDKEYLDFIMVQLSQLSDVSYRAMMGEYIIYYKGKIIGGIYDNRLLVKPVKSAVEYMSNISYELPYQGAKEMLLVDNVDHKEYLTGLLEAIISLMPYLENNFKAGEGCFVISISLTSVIVE